MVEVFGEVNDPGKFLYRKGLTIGDVILTAGGLTDGATLSNIDVARRNKNNNSKFVSDRISEVFNLDAENDTSVLSFPLDPYDMVFIRKSPNYREQQTITVRGEVSYPGTYVIEKNTVRLSDVVKRAYNVTSDAYIKGAKLVRVLTQEEYNRLLIALQVAKNKTQDSTSIDILSVGDRFDIGIDLEKALNNPGSYSDVVLRTGDILEIPKMNNTVKVSGAVLYPNTVAFNPDWSVKDYISQAGGAVKGARISRSYIVFMNGMVAKQGHSGFKVEPGCQIIVPQVNDNVKRRSSMAEILSIATSTSSLAYMISALVKLF